MKTTVTAKLEWTPHDAGGKKNVMPVAMRYCPMIVFEVEQPGDSGEEFLEWLTLKVDNCV